jgi:hypothetical protein
LKNHKLFFDYFKKEKLQLEKKRMRLGQKYFKTKKSITYISQEEKKTSINIYFIIQPFFHFKASKQ